MTTTQSKQGQVVQGLGVLRSAVGAALVVAPAAAGSLWVGSHANGHGTRVFARAIGARDVALGAAILMNARSDTARAARLVQLGAVADLADMAATLIAWRNLEGARRWATPLVAGSVAIAGVLALRTMDEVATEAEQETSNAQGSVQGDEVDTDVDLATAAGAFGANAVPALAGPVNP